MRIPCFPAKADTSATRAAHRTSLLAACAAYGVASDSRATNDELLKRVLTAAGTPSAHNDGHEILMGRLLDLLVKTKADYATYVSAHP